MDQLDTQYQKVGEAAGVPLDVVQRLTPEEMRVLACLVEHRDRIVAEPELALHVFGNAGADEDKRIGQLVGDVRFAVCKYGAIDPTFTHYHGRLAVGMQWRRMNASDDVAAGTRA